MKLLKLKPVTNGIRHQIKIQKNMLCKSNRLLKISMYGSKSFSGRDGHITIRHRGGGCKRLKRLITFSNASFYGVVLGVVYNPNKNSLLSLMFNLLTKKLFYIPHIDLVSPGHLICNLQKTKPLQLRLGYRASLNSIPVGTIISDLALSSEGYSKYIKSAGTYGQLIQKEKQNYRIKLPSGIIICTNNNSYATVGSISNDLYSKRVLGKAGKNRLKGWRSKVRGVAMNPVDHPHGGRTNGGRPSVTPWGYPTKGKPTVIKKL